MNMIQDFPESSKFFESFEIFYQRTPHWNGVLNGKVLKTKYDDRRLQIKLDNASICKKTMDLACMCVKHQMRLYVC